MPDQPPTGKPPADPAAASSTADPAADRRAFLRTAAWGGGIVGLGGLAGLAASRLARRHRTNPGTRQPLGDEFTYDISRFQTSDPSLILCDELARFAVNLERPRNLAADDNGTILVCGDGGIRRFSPEGEPRAAIDPGGAVHSVAPRDDGTMLAGLDDRLLVLDASGDPLASWDDFPDGLLPTSIAAAGDTTWVADARNRVVHKLDASGKSLAVIGRRDASRGVDGFVVPSPYFCLRVAPDGLLRITNPGEHRIEAWTTDGSFELAWGKPSFAVDGFCGCCNPVSFDVFPDGGYVTCEKGLPRVKLHDSHGEFLGLVAGPEAFPEYLRAANAGTPESLGSGIYAAIDPAGRILVLDVIGGEVRIMQRKEATDG
jgi:hypothetical protein